MKPAPDETVVTVLVIQVKRHVVPRRMVPHLDMAALEDDDRTEVAVSRKVYVDRKVGVKVEDFGSHQTGER